MKNTYWIKEKELNKIDWIKKVNRACKKWENKKGDEISLFYSYFSISEHKLFTEEICRKIGINLEGIGLEIGSGPGILSNSLLKIFNKIDKIYLLDKVPNLFELKRKIALENRTSNRLESIVGCFNDLKFENSSIDFVLDFDSIHHSDNFDKTFSEISRVLKPGGILLCFDRAQPNYISKKQIEDLLGIEYSDKYKIENNIKIGTKFTRRMNGEHEPKLKLWQQVSTKYNLKSKIYIFHKKNIKSLIRAIYGLMIPYFIRKTINKGINITTHYQIVLNYFGFNNINGISVIKMDYNATSERSPKGKMILCFQKD